MKILNVHLYLDDEDKAIKIRFEALYDEKNEFLARSKPADFINSITEHVGIIRLEKLR